MNLTENNIKIIQGVNGTYLNLYPNSGYDPTAYERPTVAVDTCICTMIDWKLKVLLIKRKIEPFAGKWAIPGGYVNIKDMEDIDDASIRELNEETGATGIPVHQLHAYGKADRDPRWRNLSIAYYALVPVSIINNQSIEAADDAIDSDWFAFDELPDMAFDHKTILSDLLSRLKQEVNYLSIAFNLVDKNFTLTELQYAYQSIIGKDLITSNFRRTVNRLYKIQEVADLMKGSAGRPAKLFNFCGTKTIF